MCKIECFKNYAEILLYNKQGREVARAKIDLDDIDKIKQYKWYYDNINGYVLCSNKGNVIRLHRFIMNCPEGMEVDHINHKKTDNRKSNLRIVNRSQNNMNHSLQCNNTSGYTGVSQSKNGKWRAYIKINKKQIHLGRYDTKEEAIKARQEAEIKYFGEYRYNRRDAQ